MSEQTKPCFSGYARTESLFNFSSDKCHFTMWKASGIKSSEHGTLKRSMITYGHKTVKTV